MFDFKIEEMLAPPCVCGKILTTFSQIHEGILMNIWACKSCGTWKMYDSKTSLVEQMKQLKRNPDEK